MKRIERRLWAAAVIGCLALSPAMGGQKWVAIGEFQAGGDGKVAAYNGTVSACRIVCTEGSVIVNTVIVLEGNKKTPIRVGVRIPAGQTHEIALPGGPRAVTGFRISDNARGKYRLDVLKMGAGGKKGKGGAESVVPGEEAAPSEESTPAQPELLPAPAGLPQSVEAEAPAAKEPVVPAKEPDVPVKTPDTPASPPPSAEPAGGTTDSGNAPLPWEVK